MTNKKESMIGCLLGTAIGDALGLPYEGMTGSRGGRMFPDRDLFHFLHGYGMVSDDTEHACFTAQAIIGAKGDPKEFERRLAWSLRWWFLGLPAGIGLATLRSILRLWVGISPARAGVFSAGNGPAMRSPLLGVAYGDDPSKLKDFVLRSTRVTHSDPKAYHGALGAAVAAHVSSQGAIVKPGEFLQTLCRHLDEQDSKEFIALIDKACASAERNEPVASFASNIGSRNGISGYMYHTMPCVIQVWLRYQKDFEGGIKEIIAAGGDADTTAAILGGILGAGAGQAGLPEQKLSRIVEWPRSVAWMRKLASSASTVLDGGLTERESRYFVPGLAIRNAMFLAIVLAHGFRRLFPPYQ